MSKSGSLNGVLKRWHYRMLAGLMAVCLLFSSAGWRVADAALPPREDPPANADGIVLKLVVNTQRPIPDALSAVVQWRHPDGTWHNVEGWNAPLHNKAGVEWWVSAELIGSGPYRWVLYGDGLHTTTSAWFDITTTRWAPQIIEINW